MSEEQAHNQDANGRKLNHIEHMITDLRQTYEETADPEKELAGEKPKMGQELYGDGRSSRTVYLFIAFVAVGLLAVVSVSVRLQMGPSSSPSNTAVQPIDAFTARSPAGELIEPVSTGAPLPLTLPEQGRLPGPDLPPPLPTPPLDTSSPAGP